MIIRHSQLQQMGEVKEAQFLRDSLARLRESFPAGDIINHAGQPDEAWLRNVYNYAKACRVTTSEGLESFSRMLLQLGLQMPLSRPVYEVLTEHGVAERLRLEATWLIAGSRRYRYKPLSE